MITFHGAAKTYGAHRAVDNVSLMARPGPVAGFLGRNGAGKSTTMRIRVGLDAARDVETHQRTVRCPVRRIFQPFLEPRRGREVLSPQSPTVEEPMP